MATTFEAKYDGWCRKCMADIWMGDVVGYNAEDELVCKRCLKEEEQELGIQASEDAPRSNWRERRKKRG